MKIPNLFHTRFRSLALLSTGLMFLSCAQNVPNTTGTEPQNTGPLNNPPIIQNLTANPTSQVAAGDKISFTVEATDTEKDALKYYWSTDQGELSAQEGYSVYWQPTGISRSGMATISLTVSDGKGGEAQGFVKLSVKADGTAQVGLISRVSCGDGTNKLDQLYANEGV